MQFFKRTHKNYNRFWKEINGTDNKRRIKTTSKSKVYYICRERILKKLSKTVNYLNVEDHYRHTSKYRGAAHTICNLKSNVPNEIPVRFHSSSSYDYHFIIKELAKEFEGDFECFR